MKTFSSCCEDGSAAVLLNINAMLLDNNMFSASLVSESLNQPVVEAKSSIAVKSELDIVDIPFIVANRRSQLFVYSLSPKPEA